MAKTKRKFNTGNESVVVQHQLGVKKRFHPHDLVPFHAKNDRQEEFFEKWYGGTELIALLGFPGAGKSRIAFQAALEAVFSSDTPYERIVLIRSIVESGEGVGYLKGSLEEKLEPYEVAYKSLTKEMMKFNDPYPMLKQLGYIEFAPTCFLRGQTFDDSIIIIEECQNYDYATLYTAITRCGINSRVILTGDAKQDDLASKRKKSGLQRLCKVMERMPQGSTHVIHFQLEDVLRSGLVADFVLADFETQD